MDWSKRPGNYAFAGSMLKGWVRVAVPIPTMVREGGEIRGGVPTT